MAEPTEVTFRYRNYKGEESVRRAIPQEINFQSTQWHPEPQWIMVAFDVDKGDIRGFALQDCDFTGQLG